MKDLFICPEPRKQDMGAIKETWQEIKRLKLSNVNIIAIQPLTRDTYTLVDHPNDLYSVEGITDRDVAPMLGLELIDPSLLTQFEHGLDWKNPSDALIYQSQNATRFGLALSGCGRMGSMMPYARMIHAYETDHAIKQKRMNFNLGGVTAAVADYNTPDIGKIARSTQTLVTTEFEPTQSRIDAINYTMECVKIDSLRALKMSHLKRK